MTAVVVDIKMAAAGDEQVNPDAPQVSFSDFWRLYPRRLARKDAEKAWARVERENYARIILALGRQRKSEDWRRDSGRYIPYPASWLNGERWNDELDGDLTMGVCSWNCNGNRLGEIRCDQPATTEKRGMPYCLAHGQRVL